MGRRYRRSRSNNIISVVPDIVHIASRLPWWGALLTGVLSYFLFAVLLGGYLEDHITSQVGTKFHSILEARFGRFVLVCNWVGLACLLVGIFFAVRNPLVAARARRDEKGIVAIISKLIARSLD